MYTERKILTKMGSLVDITEDVKKIVTGSGVCHGVAVVSTAESGAGIACTSSCDCKVHEDIVDDFNRVYPARLDFMTQDDPWRTAAHCKAAVAGQSVDFIIEDGNPILGDSQGIYFAEYYTGRERSYAVTVLGIS